MKRNILGTAIACLLLSSCATSSSPGSGAGAGDTSAAADQSGEPVRGAGEGRLVGMASAALERDLREQARAQASERTGLMQKLQEMGTELADLKNRLQAATHNRTADAAKSVTSPGAEAGAGGVMTAGPTTGAAARAHLSATAVPRSTAAIAATVASNAAVAAAVASSGASRQANGSRIGKNSAVAAKAGARTPSLTAYSRANRETIVIQDKGMVFRVMHGFARTDFHPSAGLQQQLLQAARAGKHIEIRGRTDASTANPVDKDIAMRRALNARVFLANNGIHPRKMHIDYLAAGDNVADNGTPDGRARNRRVEIETAGITPDVLEDLAALIRQDLQ